MINLQDKSVQNNSLHFILKELIDHVVDHRQSVCQGIIVRLPSTTEPFMYI